MFREEDGWEEAKEDAGRHFNHTVHPHTINIYPGQDGNQLWRAEDDEQSVVVQVFNMFADDKEWEDELKEAMDSMVWNYGVNYSHRFHRFERVPRG